MNNNTTPTENWREGLTMSDRMLALLNSDVTSVPHDISLIVGMDKEKITCHKLLLIASSHVFENMIINKSANDDSGIELYLPDQDPETVRNLLRYIYTGGKMMPSKFSTSSILSMIRCAINLAFPELIDFCWSNVQDTDDGVKMAVTIYQVLKKCNAYKEVFRKVSNFIVRNFYKVMVDGDFLEFEPRNLRGFLALDDLHIFSEVELFEHVVMWGEHQLQLKGLEEKSGNLRGVLELMIKHIRFPIMTVEQFHTFVYPKNILKDEETIQLLFGWLSQPHKKTAKFKRIPRKCRSDITVSFCEDNHSVSVIYKKETLLEDSFHISGKLGCFLLCGLSFAVQEPDNSTGELGEMSISISTAGSNPEAAESLINDTIALQRSSNSNKCLVKFDRPLKLPCELTYDITYTSKKNQLYKFTDPVEEQTFQSSNVSHATVKNLGKSGCLMAIIFTFVE